MLERVLYPAPKSKIDQDARKKLVYIPIFNNEASYNIFDQYFSKTDGKGKFFLNQNMKISSLVNLGSNEGLKLDDTNEDDDLVLSQMKMSNIKESNIGQKRSIKELELEKKSFELRNNKNKNQTVAEKCEMFLFEADPTFDFIEPKKPTKNLAICSPNIISNSKQSKQHMLSFKDEELDDGNMKVVDYKILQQSFIANMPCLYYPTEDSSYYLIYFHSNAEDIFYLSGLGQLLASELNCNVLIPEYPSYSIYKHRKAKAKYICSDAEMLLSFLTKSCRIDPSKIIVLGRSLGTGPAVHVCSMNKCALMVLISPFLSIKQVVKDKISIFSAFVDSHFDNEVKIQINKSPVLLLHGKKDTIITPRHSEELYNLTKSKAKLIIYENMSHNEFGFYECVIYPTIKYLEALKIDTRQVSQMIKEPTGKPANKKIAEMFMEKLF